MPNSCAPFGLWHTCPFLRVTFLGLPSCSRLPSQFVSHHSSKQYLKSSCFSICVHLLPISPGGTKHIPECQPEEDNNPFLSFTSISLHLELERQLALSKDHWAEAFPAPTKMPNSTTRWQHTPDQLQAPFTGRNMHSGKSGDFHLLHPSHLLENPEAVKIGYQTIKKEFRTLNPPCLAIIVLS